MALALITDWAGESWRHSPFSFSTEIGVPLNSGSKVSENFFPHFSRTYPLPREMQPLPANGVNGVMALGGVGAK